MSHWRASTLAVEEFKLHLTMMEEVTEKGTNLGPLSRAPIELKFSCTTYHKHVDQCYEYGFRENVAFENLVWCQMKLHNAIKPITLLLNISLLLCGGRGLFQGYT